jgi:signal transduction histidine kinase
MLVKPREQMKYSFLFVGGGILILTAFIGVVMVSLNKTMVSLEAAYGLDPEVAMTIRGSMTSTLAITLMLALVLAAFAVVVGVQLSHRIYGPVVPFLRHIESLSKGDYSSRVNLRKSDEFIEIQDALNGLAEGLEKKYGSSPQGASGN